MRNEHARSDCSASYVHKGYEMKAFSVICEDAFHKRFEGVSFEDDAAIHIWREAWSAAAGHIMSLVEAENYEPK
jgi:hypothetical protein